MKKIIIFLKNIRKKIQLFINKLGSSERNKKLNNKNVTIISNNCFAGITYEYLNLPFLSPTIGLYFFAPEYIKFISNLKYYATVPLEFVNINKSKYYDELVRIKQENVIIGKLDDIEIVFLHYNSFKEAKEKWEKRCKRINYDNIIFKFNDQNLCTEKELEQFNNLDLPNKICFTSKKYNNNGFIQIKRDRKRKCVRDDAFSYHKYFDVVKYINNINRKKRVLHLLYSNTFSGAENVACQIIKNTENEFDCFYCSPDGPIRNHLKEKKINFLSLEKINIKMIKNIVKKYEIDIIHAHDIKMSFYSSFIKNVDIISHIHGNHLFMRKITLKSFLFNIRTNKFKHIFWVSDSSFDSYYFKKNIYNRSSILYNVIDGKNLNDKVKLDFNNYNYDIIFVGRLMEAKNPKRLLDIMTRVIHERPNTKCAIVGAGVDYNYVKGRIEKEGLENNIKMFGFMSNPYKILQQSKIMIMTSIHEGLPMVVLEAMYLGVPIVSTPTDGINKYIDDSCGYLTDDDNLFCKKIIEILNDKKIHNNLSKNSIIRFKKLNNINDYRKEIIKFY